MANNQRESPVWHVLPSFLTAILCLVIVVIVWPLRHFFDEIPPIISERDCSGGFRIVIQDEDLAAWMTINNTFTWDHRPGTWDPSKNLWNGVLIQLGKYNNMIGGTTDILGSVKLIKDDPSTPVLTLTKGDFERDTIWINVVARRGDEGRVDPPMDWNHLDELLVIPRPAQTDPDTLHHYFTPYKGGITLWHDKGNGFDLCARQEAHQGQHDSFTFRLTGADGYVSVSQAKPGLPPTAQVYAIPSEVREIRIFDLGDPTHLDQANPPQEP